jgi:octaprenyl-diphosphate synthase
VAVELVHAATLLHDDVVDLGDTRRGAPAARALHGNAASIFAGDWLLVEALRRVGRAQVGDTLERLLDIIEEMIFAEALQLERRGSLETDREIWTRVVEGKTAALFRWAMYAGARAGGLDSAACVSLERYGQHLGVAFQAVDDVLDLDGEAAKTGKALFTDLREGKMTWPLIVALEREPSLREVLQIFVDLAPDEPAPPQACARVLASVAGSGAIHECMEMARGRVDDALEALAELPDTVATRALATVAHAAVDRQR